MQWPEQGDSSTRIWAVQGRWDAAGQSIFHLANINVVIIVIAVPISFLAMNSLFMGSGCSAALLGVRVHVQLYGELQAIVDLRENMTEHRGCLARRLKNGGVKYTDRRFRTFGVQSKYVARSCRRPARHMI